MHIKIGCSTKNQDWVLKKKPRLGVQQETKIVPHITGSFLATLLLTRHAEHCFHDAEQALHGAVQYICQVYCPADIIKSQ